ncbi:MAG: FliH/SctL family protein [Steroidobacteraceae bacterium]
MNNTNNQAAVMSADTAEATAASSWLPPAVDGPRAGRRHKPTLGELDDIEKIAWDEGYAKGHAAGLATAEKELRKRTDELDLRVRQFDAVLKTLSGPLQQLDEEVETQLVSLAFTIAKHVVRRELRADPGQVIAVIRETVGLLPLAQRNVRVHLHPLDAAIVRERLAEPQTERAWTLVEDPVMSRGGCRVSTDTAQIDARLEVRLANVLNHLLGDARLIEQRGQSLSDADGNDSDNDAGNEAP